jgi:hypothetical protein
LLQKEYGFCDSGYSISVVDSLEMLDKIEPPSIPDGYGISVAYACLLDIIRSIALTIEGASPSGNEQPEIVPYRGSEEDRELHSQLINSSWCGLLAALSPLIDARYMILINKVLQVTMLVCCYLFRIKMQVQQILVRVLLTVMLICFEC